MICVHLYVCTADTFRSRNFMCTFHSVVLLLLKDLMSIRSFHYSTTAVLQSMSVKRTMVAVRVYVWIQSIPLSVTVMLDIR